MARHAYRVPIYSSLGGSKPLMYVGRAEAEKLELSGYVKRISRLKAPNLVMRFCALQRQPKMANSSITSMEMELNALSQILSADSNTERKRIRRIAEKLSAWKLTGDDKAAPAGANIPTTETRP